MKKLIYLIWLLLIGLWSYAQTYPVYNRSNGTNTINDPRQMHSLNLFIPVYNDTVAANVQKGVDSTAGIIYTRDQNIVWYRSYNPKRWLAIGQKFGVEDSVAHADRFFNLDGNNISIVGGNFGINTLVPTETFSIGHIDGDETAVMYTPDGTVFRIETKSGASMQILSNTQLSIIPDPSGGQLVLDGSTANYINQKLYTGGGGLAGQMGIGVYDALNDETEFYFKALDFDTLTNYLTLYDKMKFVDIPNDNSITKIIGIDASDNVRYIDASAISGGGGLSGGNLGAGYRYYVPASSGIKTSIADNGLSLDSVTANILTYKLGGTLTANTTVNQSTFSFGLGGTGITTIGQAISSSTARVQISSPATGTPHLAVGVPSVFSNNVYIAFNSRDTLTTANNKSTGFFNQYEHDVRNNMTLSGWGFGNHWSIIVPDTMRADPVGSDLAGGILTRMLMKPSPLFTGRHVIKGGTFRDDYVGGVISMIENSGTTGSNWVMRRGYWSSYTAHLNFGNSVDSIETWTAYWATTLNSGHGDYANIFYCGPIGNFDTVRAYYSPYQNAYFHQAGQAYFGSAVNGNPYAAVPSAQVEIQSTTRGILIPRMTAVQQAAISSPATYLMLVNTDTARLMIYNGSAYKSVAYLTDIPAAGGGGTVTNVATGYGLSGGPITTTGTLLFDSATVFTQLRAQMWTLGGNAATAGSETGSFLGTTNSVSLRFRTNNVQRMVLDSSQGQLRINAVSSNTADGMRIKNPGNDNYSGYYVESSGGTTGTTYGYAGVVRGGAITIKSTTSNPSITPSLYVGGEFGTASDRVTIAAGSTSIAPIQMASASLTTGGNIRAGQISFLTDKFYGAITTGPAHYEFTMNNIPLTSGRISYSTTNGRQTDDADLQFDGTTLILGGTAAPAGTAAFYNQSTVTRQGYLENSTLNAEVNGTPSLIYVAGTIVEAASGTHSILASVTIAGTTVTGGGAAVTNTASLYVGVMSATVTGRNYGLLMANGAEASFSSTSFAITSTSTDITLDNTYHTVKVDASGASRTITLPAAAGCTGRVYTIKKIDASGNTVVIDGNASETIDGATTQTLSAQWASFTVQSDGTNWMII